MRTAIFTTILGIFGLVLFSVPVNAAVLDKRINRVYELKQDSVKVTETVTSKITNPQFLIPAGSEEVFTIFNPIINDPEASEKIDKVIPTIKVTDANGKNLGYTTEIDGQHVLVKVPRPSNITSGNPQKIRVTYNSYSLSNRNGALVDMYVPSFSKNFKFNDNTTTRRYTTTVRIPKSFGENNFIVPEVELANKNTYWEAKFTQQQLTGTVSWIQMGTKQFYRFSIKQPYSQTSELPLFFNTYDITLPRSVNAGPITQNVYFTKFDPEPSAVKTDKDGNLIASFMVPATESGELIVEGYTEVDQDPKYDFSKSTTLSDLDPTLVEEYTHPAEFWEADHPSILKVANEIKGDKQDVFEIVSDTYSYVVDKIDYSNVKRFGINERQGALKTLQGGAAVCMEYSDLFIALIRAQGIPARAAFGYGYDSRSTNGDQTAHQWAEVYIPGIDTWIGVDTTWGEAGPAIIGGDMNHFYKYVASEDPQSPAPVSLTFFGGVPTIADEDFDIVATQQLPTNLQYQTPEDLLQSYPRSSGLLSGLEQFSSSVTLALGTIDDGLHDWLLDSLGITGVTSSILRVILYVAPIVIAIGLAVYLRYYRQKLPGGAPIAQKE